MIEISEEELREAYYLGYDSYGGIYGDGPGLDSNPYEAYAEYDLWIAFTEGYYQAGQDS